MQNSSLAILLIYILMRGLNYTELILLAKQLYTNQRYWEAGQSGSKSTDWSTLVNTSHNNGYSVQNGGALSIAVDAVAISSLY
jgi:hypothetical protein